jgi:hypothetical protein
MTAMSNWKKVSGFPYEVSDDGQVRNLRTGYRTWGSRGHGGYRVVVLHRKGGKWTTSVHRLVLLTFVGEPPYPKAHGRHLNGDPTDNRLENLAWGTAQDNMDDKVRHGTQARGERHGRAKITAAQARAIFVDSRPQAVIAEEYDITQVLVSQIKLSKIWTDETSGLEPGRKNAPALTQELRERILALKEDGLSHRKIAGALGLKPSQVWSFLKKHEVAA